MARTWREGRGGGGGVSSIVRSSWCVCACGHQEYYYTVRSMIGVDIGIGIIKGIVASVRTASTG